MNNLVQRNFFLDFWRTHLRGVWLQRLTILGILAISAVLPLVANRTLFILILALMGLAVVLLALLRWPNLGLFGILFASFFVPFSGPGGFNLTVLSTAGLAGLWLFDMLTRQRRIFFVDKRTTTPILVFIICSVVSFLVGQLPWYPLARHAPITAQIGGLSLFVLSGAAILLVGNTIRNIRWLEAFTWAFIGISALYTFGRLVPPAGEFLRRFFQPGATTGSLFWVWMMIIPFSQALLNKRLHILIRGALGLLTVAVIYVALIQTSDWKSGYLPPLAGLAAIVALLLGRKVFWFAPLGLVAAYFLLTSAVTTDEYSAISRLDAWSIVLQLSAASPLFGLGFANYYWYTHLIPILGWHVPFNSHSQYVDLLAQTGLVGLLCFFWIFWEIGLLGLRLRDKVPEGFMRAYVYGALGGLAGTLVAGALVDWVLPFAYNIGMNGFRSSVLSWLFLGGLVAIQEIVKNQNETESETSAKGRTA